MGSCGAGPENPTAEVLRQSPPDVTVETPPQVDWSTLERLQETEPPERDLIALALRLDATQTIPRVVHAMPVGYEFGDEEQFWVADIDNDKVFQVTAVLEALTARLYLWVEKGARFDRDALERSAAQFDNRTYPSNHRLFGSEWSPGVDGDSRLHILYAGGLGRSIAGYYLSKDQVSSLAHPYSNEREMFYANLDTLQLGSSYHDGMLAHEFQHMIHWNLDRNEELWLNEGLAVLAAHRIGSGSGGVEQAFLGRPDIQLNSFLYEQGIVQAHYGASFTFALYLWERWGETATQALAAHPANGFAGVQAVLEQVGADVDVDGFLADWRAAVYLDRPDLDDGRFGFHAVDLPPAALSAAHRQYPVARTDATVSQFGTDYIRLVGDRPLTVVFTGTQQVPLLSTRAQSGEAFWWSNQGDEINTTLTRALDFTGLTSVTLEYWLWYDLEAHWDYAYLEVSTDNGRTWDILQTQHTSSANPVGNNLSHGYTGRSSGGQSPQWIFEQVDLSHHAGGPVLLRFEYVTDGAINGPGLALDSLTIPQLGYRDDFEEDDPGWQAAGFVRCTNRLPQLFAVQLITLGNEPQVERLDLQLQGSAQWVIPLGREIHEAVLIISGVTPVTRQPASYAYEIRHP
jgi:hypothetical protein